MLIFAISFQTGRVRNIKHVLPNLLAWRFIIFSLHVRRNKNAKEKRKGYDESRSIAR